MAAPIVSTATTMEGQILEIMQRANEYEAGLAEEANQGRYSVAIDIEGKTATVTATLDLIITSAVGEISITAQNYPNG